MREAFQVEGLALMIRATRGRSSRPNHMPSLLDALQTTTSVDFRRLLGSFHSVAKQASFNIAFGADFKGFGTPKWRPKSMLEAYFFDAFSDCVLASILIRVWEAPA